MPAPLLLALTTLIASLHIHLGRAEPAAGGVVAESPRELRLWFEGGVEASFTEVTLVAADRSRLALGAPVPGGAEGLVVVPVPLTLRSGRYTVAWQAVGRDGHRASGDFAFTVAGADTTPAGVRASVDSSVWGAGSPGRTAVRHGDSVAGSGAGAGAPGSPPAGASAGGDETHTAGTRPARWLELTSLCITLGGAGMLLLVLRTAPGSPSHERFLRAARTRVGRVALIAAVTLVVLTLIRLGLESVTMHGGASGIGARAIGETLATAWGRAWMVEVVGATVMLLALPARRARARGDGARPPSVGTDLALGVAAVVLAIGPASTGHAAAAGSLMPLAVLADWLHVLGAGAWIGGVLMLALAAAPAALAQPEGERAPALAWLVGSFHALAAPAIVLVVASGVLSAWLRVGSWQALTHTNYGELLLFKVYVVVGAALLGAYHWHRVHPRLVAAAGDRDARTMQWTLYAEAVAGLVVFALTAALVTSLPPR